MSDRDNHAYNEWAADALNDRDEQAAWEQQRNDDLVLGGRCVSTAEMMRRWAAERAAVEAQSHREHVAELARAKEQRGTAA